MLNELGDWPTLLLILLYQKGTDAKLMPFTKLINNFQAPIKKIKLTVNLWLLTKRTLFELYNLG